MAAEIYLNGQRVGTGTRAYSDAYYFDLKPFLKTGANRIEFRFPERKKAVREIWPPTLNSVLPTGRAKFC